MAKNIFLFIFANMKRRTFSIVVLLLTALSTLHAQKFDIEKDLLRLDSAVNASSSYEQQKRQAIAVWKKDNNFFVTPTEQYNYNKHLYDEYMKFDPDSAIYYSAQCYHIATKAGLTDLAVMAQLDGIYINILQGELQEVQRALPSLPAIETQSKTVQMKYAVVMMEYAIRCFLRDLKDDKSSKTKLHYDAWQKYSVYLPSDMWQRDYYEANLVNTDVRKRVEADLRGVQQPSIKAAMLYYVYAKQCYRINNKNAYLHYLILSAINDIGSCNREAESLIILVNSPLIHLNCKRAYLYTMLCTENAKTFKDAGRSLEIVKAHASVTTNYQKAMVKTYNSLIISLIVLALTMVAIVLLLVNVIKKRRRQVLLLKKIERQNHSLEAMIGKEKEAQRQLKAANAVMHKEVDYHNNNFLQVYQLVTKYIADVQNFKKSIFNLIASGKIDKARSELRSQSITEKYLQNFFGHFDKAFLSSHPDFVKRFNSLLKPEAAIVPPSDNELTPELRIYALVSMGITDSISIAEFLHYSPQTIYNYRLKVRHCACIPEKTFADAVAQMYAD